MKALPSQVKLSSDWIMTRAYSARLGALNLLGDLLLASAWGRISQGQPETQVSVYSASS